MKSLILLPMAIYALYMFGIALFTLMSRIRAIRMRQIHPKYFQVYSGDSPERLLLIGRHYDNQFQLPLLFFIACSLLINFERVSMFAVVLAWIFVVSRWAHSWIHLGSNNVANRAIAFAIGWVALALIWSNLLLIALGI